MQKLKTIKSIVASAILLEGVIAGFSIYQELSEPKKEHSFTNNYLLKNSRFGLECGERFLERPLQTIASTLYLVPSILRYQLGISQSIDEELQEAAQNEKTLHGIEQLLAKDDLIDYAEIGGLVFLARDENNRYCLNFLEIKSENETECLELMREQNNPEKILQYFKEGRIHEKLQVADHINELLRRIGEADKETKGELIKELIECYKFGSDYLYSPSEEGLGECIYQNFTTLDGRLIGAFHTHNMAEPPSDADLRCSKYIRQFVVVRDAKKYKIYDLHRGETNNTYTIPAKEPQKQ